uniref:hypothetical protein n=1 Tax=Microcystis sp. LSC13-02 TaxID=1895004 RepID=UPI00257DF7F1
TGSCGSDCSCYQWLIPSLNEKALPRGGAFLWAWLLEYKPSSVKIANQDHETLNDYWPVL